MTVKLPDILDIRFRTAVSRLAAANRLEVVSGAVDTEYEIASVLKRRDGDRAVIFPQVDGYNIPVMGNFLCSKENCEAAFGMDFKGIRQLVVRALGTPIPPQIVDTAPWKKNVYKKDIDIGAILPVLRHAEDDPGRFITAGVVIVQDPDTGVYNASYHRLQLIGGNRTAIKLDFGRDLRAAFEKAKSRGQDLPVAVCIGTDLGLLYTAATMGSQMPPDADELAAAGSLIGKALPVTRGLTQDLLIPVETEIVLEGKLLHDQVVHEGPFAEFIGYMSADGDAPIFEVSSLAHRDDPIYYAINGFGRETAMLRKYVLEASLLKVLQASTPVVKDVNMTAGGLHRFHAVLEISKKSSQHNGWQRNAMLAAFGALKDLDMVIAVDDDIDIHDQVDVEYALATRMDAACDITVISETRGHEYVRVGKGGIRAKLAIDATIPFEDKARYARAKFRDTSMDPARISVGGSYGPDWLNP